MTINELHRKIDQLPESLADEVNDFISFLLVKWRKQKQLDMAALTAAKKRYLPDSCALSEVAGSLAYHGKAKTLADIEQDIAKGIAEDYGRH